MTFNAIPATYRNVILEQYLAEMATGEMAIERYEQLTGESYPIVKEAPDEI